MNWDAVLDVGLTALGVALIGVGAWWVSPSAGLISVGSLLLGLVVISRRGKQA